MNADSDNRTPPVSNETTDWISRRDIVSIEGALKPGAYVARAYLVQKESGRSPEWARKDAGGKWLFDRAYIVRDAQLNLKTIGISEAAYHVGTSRRTIQTWFDAGVLHAFEDDRAAGESRHIDRAAFMNALPDLKMRLNGPSMPRHAPAIAPAQVDEATLSKSDRRSIAALRKRLSGARTRREAVLKEVRAAEKAASAQDTIRTRIVARIDKLRKHFNERLKALEKTQSYAERKQAAETERSRRLTLKAQDMMAREDELARALDERLASSKRRQAEALSKRLEQARRPDDAAGASPLHGVDRLRAASQRFSVDAPSDGSPAARERAERIAESLIDDIDAGVLDHIDAAILFNTMAEQNQIPGDVRIAVTRDYFSRG